MFKNHLQNRRQFVVFNGFKSESKLLRCGVPQGSIIGPLLFLIYINDLCNTSNSLRYILQSVFNNELDIVSDWLHMNILSINAKKTNFMMFTNKHFDIEHLHIQLAGSEIKHVPSLKFLGVTIDNKLTCFAR